jgi:hypothetical protein
MLRLRYGIVPALEPAAFVMLVAALASALLGWRPRASCLVAAALLYHFAPFEEILTTATGPYLHGLTLPVLGLAILATAPAPGAAPSPDHRWPVALIRVLLAFQYLFAGLAKLRFVGVDWASADNMQAMAHLFMTYEAPPPWAGFVATHAAAAAALGAFLLALDLSFVLAALVPKTARVLVPLAGVAHVLVYQVFGVFSLSAPLLLLFVDWDAVKARNSRA